MKKLLTFYLSILYTGMLFAQASITITGPSTVEVGIPYTYSLQFNPQYPNNSANVQADGYVITEWIVSTGTNGASGSIPGYINTPANNGSYYYDGTFNNSSTKNVPIQWSDGTFLTSDIITVKISGYYKINSTGEAFGHFNYQPQTTKNVTVERLISPVINGPSPVLSCSQVNQTYSISNITNGNQIIWQTTGGAVIVGSSTSSTVNITPPLSGGFGVTCTIKRSSANPNYSKTTSKTITRTLFNTSALIIGNQTICNTSSYSVYGLESGLSVLSWSANNPSVATLNNNYGNTTSLTKVSQGNVILTATIINSCNETTTITKEVIIGTPVPFIEGNTCVSNSTPCFLNSTPNNNYFLFTLSAPIGNFIPLTSDWEWEKISGNFFFLKNGVYNSSTAVGKQSNLYITGSNPIDNSLKFKCRVKNTCGWSDWRYFEWNDGTTTPILPPPPPDKYYKVAPNPTGGYSANILLLDSTIVPNTSTPPIIKLYSIYGQELSTTQMSNNLSGLVYVYSFSHNTMYITITFNNHTEYHTIVKY